MTEEKQLPKPFRDFLGSYFERDTLLSDARDSLNFELDHAIQKARTVNAWLATRVLNGLLNEVHCGPHDEDLLSLRRMVFLYITGNSLTGDELEYE